MMKVGMLWFDDATDRPLATKIDRAMKHYKRKYGSSPNICYVHPCSLQEIQAPDPRIKVVGVVDMLPHHFWLGIGDTSGSNKDPDVSAAVPEGRPGTG